MTTTNYQNLLKNYQEIDLKMAEDFDVLLDVVRTVSENRLIGNVELDDAISVDSFEYSSSDDVSPVNIIDIESIDGGSFMLRDSFGSLLGSSRNSIDEFLMAQDADLAEEIVMEGVEQFVRAKEPEVEEVATSPGMEDWNPFLKRECQCHKVCWRHATAFQYDLLMRGHREIWMYFMEGVECAINSKITLSHLRSAGNRDPMILESDRNFLDIVNRSLLGQMVRWLVSDGDIERACTIAECGYTSDEVLTLLYELRSIVGLNDDYGMKEKYQFRGQGMLVSKLSMEFMEAMSEPGMNVPNYVKHIGTKVGHKLKKMFHFMGETVTHLLTDCFDYFVRYVAELALGRIGVLATIMVDSKTKMVLGGVILFCFWVVLKLLHVASSAIAESIFNLAVRGGNVEDLVAQDAFELSNLIAILCMGVIGLTAKDYSKIKSMIGTAMTLMAGGTVVKSVVKSLLVLLPTTLRTSLVYKFGTEDQKFEFEVEQWRSVALSLTAVSKIQTVVGSPQYAAKVAEYVKSGGSIIRRMGMGVKTTIRSTMITTYIKLISIHTNLVTKKYNCGDRQIPFAFHVAGPPGIGKTTSIKQLIVEACDFSRTDIYSKDVADTYWSGLLDHPVIVMDEFLLGQPDKNYETVESYLTMVSSGEWRPDFASVDDPNVGIKGNVCRPKMVVSLNNTPYDFIDHKVDNAFQRRRRFIVNCRRSQEFRPERDNIQNVDMSKYSDDELRDRIWMSFDILPPVHSANVRPVISGLTYNQLVKFLREQYEIHCELQQRVNSIINSSVIDDKSPTEILDEVMRDAFSIPDKPLSVLDAFKSVFTSKEVAPEGGVPITDEMQQCVIDEVKNQGEICTQIAMSDSVEEDSVLSKAYGFAKTNMVGIATAGLLAIAGAIAYHVTGEKEDIDIFHAQSDKASKISKAKARARKMVRMSKNRVKPLHSQGPKMDVITIGDSSKKIRAMAIYDHWFLTYRHGIVDRWIDSEITLNYRDEEFKFNLNSDCIFSCEEDDICLFYVDSRQLPRFKNIIKNFVKEEEIEKLGNSHVMVDTLERRFFSTMVLGKNVGYTIDEGKRMNLEKCGSYQATTERGDCGAPVYAIAGPMANRIIGIHVAGSGASAIRPIGVCSFVTQEMLRDVVLGEPLEAQDADEEPVSFQNLIYERKINSNEIVNLPRTTKLQRSVISKHLPRAPTKAPAILHSSDPRANGRDPIEVSLLELYDTQKVKLDEALCKRIEDELFAKYRDGLKFEIGKRALTFEEACKGVPNLLNSIRCSTSPGYPLCNIAQKKGKTDFVWFEGQEIKYTEEFKIMVEARVVEMNNYNGEELNHRFLGFLKDELRSEKKIQNCETRMIFANDLVTLVAFRMIFGSLLSALMNSFECTGFAIGLNQYSHDMNGVYEFLKKYGENFTAGDYKGFDKRFVRQTQLMAYRIFCRVAKYHLRVSQNACDYLIVHETQCPFQIESRLVLIECGNLSGCFLTAPVNCIVNNIYKRYVFYRAYPMENFEDNIGLVVLGDDHITSNDGRLKFTAKFLQDGLKELGQIYTSAFKDREVVDDYEKFEDITFLGAIPRISNAGYWTGALRKETLEETIHWTRDKDGSLNTTCQQMLDCASQWDEEYYDEYRNMLKDAFQDANLEWNLSDNYHGLHYMVAGRTAASGKDFVRLHGQGPVEDEQESECLSLFTGFVILTVSFFAGLVVESLARQKKKKCVRFQAQGPMVEGFGFTKVVTSEEEAPCGRLGNLNESIADLSVAAEKVRIPYGSSSFVKRTEFGWANTDTRGTNIATFQVPFGLLNLGNLNTAQNIGFMNFLYSQCDVEVAFQINGTPVQQGALIVYFVPFYTGSNSFALTNYTTFDHLILTPNNNSTRVLQIPFRFWRVWINNKVGFTNPSQETMGTIFVSVLSPLSTATLPTTASISMFTKFNAVFSVPRPRTINGQGPVLDFNISTSSSNNSISGSSIGGAVPSQGGITSGKQSSQSKVKTLPLDNPPVSGGGNPVLQKWDSFAKAIGPAPTNSLQMHPAMMHREPEKLSYLNETLVADLCSRRGYINSYAITTAQTSGTEIFVLPLNSTLAYNSTATAGDTSTPLAVLNQFQFWRADFVFDFFLVKTVFHTVRLQAVTAYGVSASVAATDWTGYPSETLEFTGNNQWRSIRVPFNAGTEFLRTMDPSKGTVADCCMGVLNMFTLNPLKVSSSIVSSSVELMVFVRLDNVRVYEPRSSTYLHLRSGQPYSLVGQSPMEVIGGGAVDVVGAIAEGAALAMGYRGSCDPAELERSPAGGAGGAGVGGEVPGTSTIDTAAMAGDQDEGPVIGTTEHRQMGDSAPCQLDVGAKFEYTVKDIIEIGRRYHWVQVKNIPGYAFTFTQDVNDGFQNNRPVRTCYISWSVTPVHPVTRLFQMWSGHMKYRIVVTTKSMDDNDPESSRMTDYYGAPIRVCHDCVWNGTSTYTIASTNTNPFQDASVANTNDMSWLTMARAPAAVGRTLAGTSPIWNANTYIYKDPRNVTSPAVEYLYPIAPGVWIGDVSVPFNTNYNYLPVRAGGLGEMDPYNGKIVLEVPADNETEATSAHRTFSVDVYEAFGDDFRLHGYCPDVQTQQDYIVSGTITNPVGGTILGGLRLN